LEAKKNNVSGMAQKIPKLKIALLSSLCVLSNDLRAVSHTDAIQLCKMAMQNYTVQNGSNQNKNYVVTKQSPQENNSHNSSCAGMCPHSVIAVFHSLVSG